MTTLFDRVNRVQEWWVSDPQVAEGAPSAVRGPAVALAAQATTACWLLLVWLIQLAAKAPHRVLSVASKLLLDNVPGSRSSSASRSS